MKEIVRYGTPDWTELKYPEPARSLDEWRDLEIRLTPEELQKEKEKILEKEK